jgi:hypothetical protein
MAITPSGYQLLVGDGINNVVKTVNLNTGARPHIFRPGFDVHCCPASAVTIEHAASIREVALCRHSMDVDVCVLQVP